MNPKDILDAWNLLVRAYRVQMDTESRGEGYILAGPFGIRAFWILDHCRMVYPYFTGQGR